jgi:DNA (cytosine-5)-methyltransferase 1
MVKTGISLFSGAGGMDVGFAKAGIATVWANDIDEAACASYHANHGNAIHPGSILTRLPDLGRFECVDVLFGGPPCQGFSVAGKMDLSDHRSQLVYTFMDAVRIARPRAFVLENVRGLAELPKFRKTREQLFRSASELEYDCTLVVVTASDFGVPQARQRMFLVGFRDGRSAADFPKHLALLKRRAPSVREVLLPLGRAGTAINSRICRAKVTTAAYPVLRPSPYAGMLFNGQGRPLNPAKYASTLPASMGGNRTPIIDEHHLFDDTPSWVEEYHAHLWAGGAPNLGDVPERLRRLTIDEALRLQTFPDDYIFMGPQSSVFSQIGNAVPCELAFAVGQAISMTLDAAPVARSLEPQYELTI